jgi:hypothetical protein
MKLINSDGKFDFIKNGIVDIDDTLPKYKTLNTVKTEKEERSSSFSPLPSNHQEGDNLTISEISDTPKMSANYVDENLRNKIKRMKSDNLREFLGSEDAKEFNKAFGHILLGEVNGNKWSIYVTPSNIMDYSNPQRIKNSFWDKIKDMWTDIVKKFKNRNEALRVIDFFDMIHIEAGKEKDFIDKISGYFRLLDNAYKMNQVAQIDSLSQQLMIQVYESVLAVHGYNRYISFGKLQSLKQGGKKVIDIDYIKNFNRIIPTEIVEKKIKCDEFHVFDNYCVMYYDPSGETYAKTSRAKRDPILFGLINHSEKLYYIADWEDEYCDLTLEDIAERANIVETI